jgi:hypothetical protein
MTLLSPRRLSQLLIDAVIVEVESSRKMDRGTNRELRKFELRISAETTIALRIRFWLA